MTTVETTAKPPAVTPVMRAVLRRALRLERSFQGEPWVAHPHKRVIAALVAQGLAEPYFVTPGDRPHHLITDAGRSAAA